MNIWMCLTIIFAVLAMMLFFEVLNQKDNVKKNGQIIERQKERVNDLLKTYQGVCDEITNLKKPEVKEFKVVTTHKRPVSLHYSIEMPYDISDCPNIQREVTQQAIEQLAHDIIGNDLYTHHKTTNFKTCSVRHEYRVDMFKED